MLSEALKEISEAPSLFELANVKAWYVGKKSALNDMLKKMATLPHEERPHFGQAINTIKSHILNKLEEKERELNVLSIEREKKKAAVDITMPGRPLLRGNLHPITKIQREIEDIFLSMGFEVAEGYDVEDEFHNFDALNTPQDHPSRNLADTFYIEKDVLLRSQTSTVQIRVMENNVPPIRIISPGRCYRNDKADYSHMPMFHQVEALVVDKGITFADLKNTLDVFVKRMFGSGVKSRFRPHFFPFTEPSAETDIQCVICGGKGCSVCKHSGWLELGGSGMVDPNVFKHVGIDPEIYTGFAFGLGIDRIALLRHSVPDLRMLFENDLRLLKQL